jgi:hypothetical protein
MIFPGKPILSIAEIERSERFAHAAPSTHRAV